MGVLRLEVLLHTVGVESMATIVYKVLLEVLGADPALTNFSFDHMVMIIYDDGRYPH